VAVPCIEIVTEGTEALLECHEHFGDHSQLIYELLSAGGQMLSGGDQLLFCDYLWAFRHFISSFVGGGRSRRGAGAHPHIPGLRPESFQKALR
jgi:hypothetical protein